MNGHVSSLLWNCYTFCWVPLAWWSVCWRQRLLPTTIHNLPSLPVEPHSTPASANCPPWSHSAGPLCIGMWLTVPASLALSNCSYSSRWFLTWSVALCAHWPALWCGNTGTRSFMWVTGCAPWWLPKASSKRSNILAQMWARKQHNDELRLKTRERGREKD